LIGFGLAKKIKKKDYQFWREREKKSMFLLLGQQFEKDGAKEVVLLYVANFLSTWK
jgi:hypothetical protein